MSRRSFQKYTATTIYADGCWSDHNLAGGWGYVVVSMHPGTGDFITRELFGGLHLEGRAGSSDVMEAWSIFCAADAARAGHTTLIVNDSQSVVEKLNSHRTLRNRGADVFERARAMIASRGATLQWRPRDSDPHHIRADVLSRRGRTIARADRQRFLASQAELAARTGA